MMNRRTNDKVMNLWRKLSWVMDNSEEGYSNADKKWLSRNIALLITFYDQADKIRNSGRKISQRKLGHDLRWNTAVRDDSDDFKIINAGITLLAHTYNDFIGDEYFTVNARKQFEEKS